MAVLQSFTFMQHIGTIRRRSGRRRRAAVGSRRCERYDGHCLMQRRDFLKIAGVAAASGGLVGQQQQSFLAPAGPQDVAKTDFTLQIAPITVELAPNRIISTIGYNGTSPGPLLRMKEGVPVTVNVVNNPDVPEFVHFHGLL